MSSSFRVVDLFAGPGGLGEGFARAYGGARFDLAISVEMEQSAHSTLTLRSYFRKAQGDKAALNAYYDFCHSGTAKHPKFVAPLLWKLAQDEAHQLTLGKPDHNLRLDELLTDAKLPSDQTVLIGGPPCQAYSLVGRSRNRGKQDYVAEQDHRHFLYREYLRILHRVRPAVFVMENVKGILSSKVGGRLVFHDILRDLVEPGVALGIPRDGLKYRIYSLVSPVKFEAGGDPRDIDANSFIIESERFGIPQARHRVILLGVRSDVPYEGNLVLQPQQTPISVLNAIGDLPPLRSRLSRGDSDLAWQRAVLDSARSLFTSAAAKQMDSLAFWLRSQALAIHKARDVGALRMAAAEKLSGGDDFQKWVADRRLAVWLNHEARAHMPSDLRRYYYVSAFGLAQKRTPKGPKDFVLPRLAPAHANWKSGKFIDRFRVQLGGRASSTITSHIAKDGHYFIHPEPWQCRSLTVREAARLQTFPDNYFFQGNRTQQYHQVGNAVPSLLANQIANLVGSILTGRHAAEVDIEGELLAA